NWNESQGYSFFCGVLNNRATCVTSFQKNCIDSPKMKDCLLFLLSLFF
ncbi:hypothetical protein HOLDEFILI_04132, partial [Holdemania filiformis DSM 12042]